MEALEKVDRVGQPKEDLRTIWSSLSMDEKNKLSQMGITVAFLSAGLALGAQALCSHQYPYAPEGPVLGSMLCFRHPEITYNS